MPIACPNCGESVEAPAGDQVADTRCPACETVFQFDPQATVVRAPLSEERRLGRFVLRETLGSGGFGTVYKAIDPDLDRVVAIKVPHAGRLGAETDRFLREARSVAQLRHPGIVAVHDVGEADGVPYIVSEFVPGVTLADRLTAGPVTPRQAAEWCVAVAEALHAAHSQGVVHRDVKPANIMLDESGRTHLMDFGLAKRDAGEVTVTLDGQVLGTPAYMSPEQASGEARNVDGRSDVYSLGVVLYQMLAGELPFRGNLRMIIHQVLNDEPTPPRRRNDRIPRSLEAICLRAIQKEPADRYATAQDLADDLRRYLNGEPTHARAVGFFGHVWAWVRHPERVREAGVLMILLSLVNAIYSLWTFVDVIFGRETIAEAVYGVAYFTVQFGIGRYTVARRRWAIYVGLSITLIELIRLGLPVIEPALRADYLLRGDGNETYSYEFLYAVILCIQLGAYTIALLAYHSNRNVMRWALESRSHDANSGEPRDSR